MITIPAFLLDFNLFSFEITKNYFNGNSDEEGEGSNSETRIPISSILNPPSSEEIEVMYEE